MRWTVLVALAIVTLPDSDGEAAVASRYDAARAQMLEWIEAGALVPRHITYEGLGAAGGAFVDLLAVRTVGTTIVRLGD
ncbi:hypothetical protein [Candidatus Poriferisodalis sp.]|uniref:hypothetical protein n=1 Tax=Candidatus Poriferisodalis sp. TaxID=3101277 RepID=UPI003B019455